MTTKKAMTRIAVGLLAAAAALSSPMLGAADEAGKPVLRIPKMAAPPVIDGKIGDDEWAGAAEVTGFTSTFMIDQYPADMRGTWHLGYDDSCLYLAMHLPVPKGVTLNAQTKDPADCDNENSILFGDHVEIQISPHSAQRAMQTGFGFYKFIVNPFDVYSDWWYNCDRPGDERGWGPGTKVKSTFDLGNWWLEMAIPIVGTIKSPDGGMIKKTDGLELIMQLVNTGSCGGYSYGGWVPACWLEWDRFYRVILDPQAPVMQFTDTGELVAGKLDAKIRMRGTDGQSAKLSAEVFDVDGKSVFKQEKNLSLKQKEWSLAEFQQSALAVPEWSEELEKSKKRNRLVLVVESDGKTVYSGNMPFVKHTPEWTKKTYGEYLGFLPKGDYKTRIAYIPVSGKFRVIVDTDVLGDIPQAVRDAKEFRLRIQKEGDAKSVLDRKLPIVNGVGSHLLDLGPLEGAYAVTIDLLDGKGDAVSTRKHSFARVKHEWEGNTIGEERAVIPPFRPIEFAGDTLKTRWAEFKLGKGGLWDSVTAFGFQILTAPMRIEGAADGKELTWQCEAAEIQKGKGRTFPPEFDQYAFMVRDCPKIPFEKLAETDGYEACVSGRGGIGNVNITVNATMDYDGYTRFRITYAPAAGAQVKMDRLEVVLDLFGGINGMGLARETIPHMFSLPAGQQGLLWESAAYNTRQPAFKGTFVPLLHLGDGKFGLQFRAASDEGWLLDDKISCMRVERHGGTVRLRLLLVNAPATLDRARTVDFALMALPAKAALPASRHFIWGGPARGDYRHAAYGWRKYGTGADNWYLPSDEDFVKLATAPGEHKSSPDKPTMRYSSFVGIGAPLPDCDSFRGQWFKDSEAVFKGAIQGDGKWISPTGHKLDKPECFTEFHAYGWDEDLRDNYMWFHRKLVALSHSNGVYWDNAEIEHSLNLDAGTYGYVRDDGHRQPTNDSYHKRMLMKRLYTMGWLEGKPPLYNSKFAWQAPFEDIYYEWEGPWYIYTDDGTFFDGWQDLAGLRLFRSGSSVPATINPCIPGQNRRAFDYAAQRSYFALAILHDMGVGCVSAKNSVLLQKLDDEIGFLDKEKQAEFIPYWEADKLVRLVEWTYGADGKDSWREWTPEGVYVSVYRSLTRPGKTMLWFVNANDRTAVTGLRFDPKALTGFGRGEIVVRNLETGDVLSKALPPSVTDAADKETLWGGLTVPPKDFRAVIVEKGEGKPVYNPWP